MNSLIKNKVLSKTYVDNGNNLPHKEIGTDINYTIRKTKENGITFSETNNIEDLSKESYATNYKYGVKITVQKKYTEQVHVFDADIR